MPTRTGPSAGPAALAVGGGALALGLVGYAAFAVGARARRRGDRRVFASSAASITAAVLVARLGLGVVRGILAR